MGVCLAVALFINITASHTLLLTVLIAHDKSLVTMKCRSAEDVTALYTHTITSLLAFNNSSTYQASTECDLHSFSLQSCSPAL